MLMTLRICVTLFLLSVSGFALASQHKLASSSANSIYHSIGVALEAAVSIYLTPSTDIRLTSISTTSARENVRALSNGQVDFATIPSLLGYQARTGTGALANLGPQSELRAVAMMVPAAYHILLRQSALQSRQIDDLFSLSSDRLELGIGGSDTNDVTKFLFRHFDVPIDRIAAANLDNRSINDSFLDNEIDAVIATGNVPIPDIESLMTEANGELALIGMSDTQLQQINDGYDLFSSITIPAGTYPNQNEAIETLALPIILATRADVDEEVVYQLAKLMFEQINFLKTIHPAMAALDFETALDHLSLPLHPGAVRYYRDYGMTLADTTTAPLDYPVYTLDADDPEQRRIETNTGVVGVMVDPDPTSMQVASEMAVVVNSAQGDLRVVVQRGEGSAKIVNDLLYMKGVDLGIVQADVLDHFRRQEETAWLPRQLHHLTRLYDREVHILARSEISGLLDLAGKTVNFGMVGSASERTAANIFSHLGIAVEQQRDPFEFALAKLKKGEIDAMVVVGGKPLTSITSIQTSTGLRLLNVPMIGDHHLYQRATFSREEYPNLIAEGEKIRSLSVPAVLVTYRWPKGSDRYQLLSRFFGTLKGRFGQFQTSEQFHPKWRDVSLEATFDGWPLSTITLAPTIPSRDDGAVTPTVLPTPRALPLPTPGTGNEPLSTFRPANEPS